MPFDRDDLPLWRRPLLTFLAGLWLGILLGGGHITIRYDAVPSEQTTNTH